MTEWEDKLILALSERRVAAAAATSPALDPMMAAFAAVIESMASSISRVASAVGATVIGPGTGETVHWAFEDRNLSVRYQPGSRRIRLSSGTTGASSTEELRLEAGRLVDESGTEVTPESLAARYVPLLFDVS